MKHDLIIVGGGIVGLATAIEAQNRWPAKKLLLLEKEGAPARHQSGRNSGVIHGGVYYEPGSLKARFCREGLRATYAFCREHGLPFRRTGKLLVATDEIERERMHALFERCRENGLDPEMIGPGRLRELEPAISGAGAIRVTESGITDFAMIARTLLGQFVERGGTARFDVEVTVIEELGGEVRVGSGDQTFRAERLVVCAGLLADRMARMQGLDQAFRIIPFRGEYFRLRPELGGLVRHLIYPIPDPGLPFLGVHLTPRIDGSILVGPNAVQSWKREGYGAINFSLRDTAETVSWPGFWKLSARNFRHGVRETWNSLWKRAYLKEIRKYCPQIVHGDLLPHPPGIRAQAVRRDGAMVDDFLIEQTPRSVHVCNAPSPAATSAIPIGRHICDRLIGKS